MVNEANVTFVCWFCFSCRPYAIPCPKVILRPVITLFYEINYENDPRPCQFLEGPIILQRIENINFCPNPFGNLWISIMLIFELVQLPSPFQACIHVCLQRQFQTFYDLKMTNWNMWNIPVPTAVYLGKLPRPQQLNCTHFWLAPFSGMLAPPWHPPTPQPPTAKQLWARLIAIQTL